MVEKLYFANCATLEEVKKRFHELAKNLHPDCGGSAEEFKRMMSQYKIVFERYKNIHKTHTGEEYEKETEETPEEWAEMIAKLLHMPGVVVEVVGSWLWLTGNTKEHKEEIKAMGFKWSKNKTAWYYHGGQYKRRGKRQYSMNDIREMYGYQRVENDQKAVEG